LIASYPGRTPLRRTVRSFSIIHPGMLGLLVLIRTLIASESRIRRDLLRHLPFYPNYEIIQTTLGEDDDHNITVPDLYN
jgi:hypothetical protein